MNDSILSLIEWFRQYQINLILSFVVFLSYLVFKRLTKPRIETFVNRDNLKDDTFKRAILSMNVFSGIISFALILFIWGFDFKGLLALSTGIIAITGVALFANWSILSNITAFFILLTQQTFRRGNYIRIIDLDNYIEGYISEITIFNTKLISDNREVIVYPNNLLIARPSIINPKQRIRPVGKTVEFEQLDIDNKT